MTPADTDPSDDDLPDDDAPTPEELALVRRATPADAAAVDALVMGHCSPQWRKVAMVVGASLSEFDARFGHLPYVYVQVRMLDLVQRGALEAQGDVMAMRHAEIRLAAAP